MRCCPASNYIHDDSTARSFVQLATVKYDRPPEIAVEIVGKIDSFVIAAAAAALFSGSTMQLSTTFVQQSQPPSYIETF